MSRKREKQRTLTDEMSVADRIEWNSGSFSVEARIAIRERVARDIGFPPRIRRSSLIRPGLVGLGTTEEGRVPFPDDVFETPGELDSAKDAEAAV